jgi:hypothetical protein
MALRVSSFSVMLCRLAPHLSSACAISSASMVQRPAAVDHCQGPLQFRPVVGPLA